MVGRGSPQACSPYTCGPARCCSIWPARCCSDSCRAEIRFVGCFGARPVCQCVRHKSANGAFHTSPGQRPGSPRPINSQALKGRPISQPTAPNLPIRFNHRPFTGSSHPASSTKSTKSTSSIFIPLVHLIHSSPFPFAVFGHFSQNYFCVQVFENSLF